MEKGDPHTQTPANLVAIPPDADGWPGGGPRINVNGHRVEPAAHAAELGWRSYQQGKLPQNISIDIDINLREFALAILPSS